MTEREEQLERRVRWLDRARRSIAIALGVACAVITFVEMSTAMGDDWPQVHTNAAAIAAGVVGWLFSEVALAWVTAIWETELDRLLSRRGLPRAELSAASSRRWKRRAF